MFIFKTSSHDFFQNIPLLKGLYLRFTLNINQPSVTFNKQNYVPAVIDPTSGAVTTPEIPASLSVVNMTNPLGGVNPLMIASALPDAPKVSAEVCARL